MNIFFFIAIAVITTMSTDVDAGHDLITQFEFLIASIWYHRFDCFLCLFLFICHRQKSSVYVICGGQFLLRYTKSVDVWSVIRGEMKRRRNADNTELIFLVVERNKLKTS